MRPLFTLLTVVAFLGLSTGLSLAQEAPNEPAQQTAKPEVAPKPSTEVPAPTPGRQGGT